MSLVMQSMNSSLLSFLLNFTRYTLSILLSQKQLIIELFFYYFFTIYTDSSFSAFIYSHLCPIFIVMSGLLPMLRLQLKNRWRKLSTVITKQHPYSPSFPLYFTLNYFSNIILESKGSQLNLSQQQGIPIDVFCKLFDGKIVFDVILQLEQLYGSFIKHILQGKIFLNQLQFLVLTHLLYLYSDFDIVSLLQSLRVSHHGLSYYAASLELFLHCSVVIFQTILTQLLLDLDLLNSIPQERKLSSIEVLIALVSNVVRLFFEQIGKLDCLFLSLKIILFKGRFQCRYLFSHLQKLLLATVQVVLSEFFQNISPYEKDKLVDLFASVSILVTEGVENYTTVNVHIFTKGIVLKCESCIDHWTRDILLLLTGLLFEERLIVLEVLEGRFDPEIDLVLQHLYHFAMEGHILSPLHIPFFEHLVVGLLLLESHLHQHTHLLHLHVLFVVVSGPRRRRVCFVKVYFRRGLFRIEYFRLLLCLLAFHAFLQALQIVFKLLLIFLLSSRTCLHGRATLQLATVNNLLHASIISLPCSLTYCGHIEFTLLQQFNICLRRTDILYFCICCISFGRLGQFNWSLIDQVLSNFNGFVLAIG